MAGKTTPKSDETDAIIWQGATQTQLLKLFQSDQPRIKAAIAKVTSCGMRNNYPIYRVHEIARHIVRPSVTPEDMEKYLQDSDHRALPPSLRKEFWIAMRQRQEYQLKAGELWPTTKVIEHVGALIKLINMSMRLMTDTVERQVELTERQRNIIKSNADAMLMDLQEAMREHFAQPEGIDVPLSTPAQLIAEVDQDDDEI